MNDDADRKLEMLFAAVRAEPPDTARAEFGFETRLMARLREEAGGSLFAWAWRLCPIFAVLALAAVWAVHSSLRVEAAAQFVSGAAHENEEQLLLAYMTGERR
jgi:hypothetical protein